MTSGLAIQGDDFGLVPVHPLFVAAERCGAWIDPQGKVYPVPDGNHDQVAERLRAAGCGPERNWDVSRPWLSLKSNGVVYGTRMTERQWVALTDIAESAGGNFGANITESVRATRALVGMMPDRFASGQVAGVSRLLRSHHEGD